MKHLFRYLLLFICVCCLLSFGLGSAVAAADETYYTVQEGQNIEFYYYRFGTQSTFVLPYGYSFADLGTTEENGGVEYVSVRFGGFTGYVRASDLSGMTPAETNTPLPTVQVAITVEGVSSYRLVSGVAERLEELDMSDVFYYLGTYRLEGKDYYAVYKEGSKDVVYVLQSHTNKSEVEAVVHPVSVGSGDAIESGTPIGTDAGTTKQGFTWMRFALILGIIIPLITIVIMIVRPRRVAKKAARREIYEDVDDYDGMDEV